MFFISWQLWEKMTFVLAICILVVFGIGYGKLIWINRIVKKQELVDEEKRMRIQELRNSGQIIESRKSHDIPFGVRAIQSGIKVDGIWISQSNTPAASELKLEVLPGSASDTTESKSGQNFVDVRPISRHAIKSQPPNEIEILRNLEQAIAAHDVLERPGSSGTRASYKPKRASQLRYGSHGNFDEEALQQLEGRSPPRKAVAHRPRPSGSRHAETEAESSAADNELSSGVSSHSETSLSNNVQFPSEVSTRNDPLLNISNVPSGKAVHTAHPIHGSKAEYFSIPTTPLSIDLSDPFQTPLPSPPLASTRASESTPAQAASSSSYYGDGQEIPDQPAQVHSPFVPGELHINKSVRKVNSGFEVLPAGTFGAPAEFKGKGIDLDYEDDSGERRQSKLQKKPRTSMTGRRASSQLERA